MSFPKTKFLKAPIIVIIISPKHVFNYHLHYGNITKPEQAI